MLLGATPPPDSDAEERAAVVRQMSEINIRAGRSFNRGLRLVYFALASLAWLLGPVAFAFATLATTWMLYRREFRSGVRQAMEAER